MTPSLSTAFLRTQGDERLGLLAGLGSDRAFEALTERYRKPLIAYARRLGAGGSAEDVVQQAFLNTWQSLGTGTDLTTPKAWLYRVVHNMTINAVQRGLWDVQELPDALPGTLGVDEQAEQRVAVQRALADIAALPESQREALVRSALRGESQSEIARAMGATEVGVRRLVHRARQTLREAATVIIPFPLAEWLGGDGWMLGTRAPAAAASRIGELAPGGSASSGAVAKAVAVVATAGVIAVGPGPVPGLVPEGEPPTDARAVDGRSERKLADGAVEAAVGNRRTSSVKGRSGPSVSRGDPSGEGVGGKAGRSPRRARDSGDGDRDRAGAQTGGSNARARRSPDGDGAGGESSRGASRGASPSRRSSERSDHRDGGSHDTGRGNAYGHEKRRGKSSRRLGGGRSGSKGGPNRSSGKGPPGDARPGKGRGRSKKNLH